MFFKRIVGALALFSVIATPAYAKFSSGSSFSSRPSSSSFSSGSTFRSSSYSRPSYTSTYTRPVTAPRFNSGSTYNYRPAQTVGRYSGGNYYTNRGYNPGPTYVNHNYGGGTFSSPWFWMWMMDRNHQTPVYVNGGAPVAQGGVGAPVVVDNGPGFFSTIFWGIFNLLILIGFVWLVVWLLRKFLNSRR